MRSCIAGISDVGKPWVGCVPSRVLVEGQLLLGQISPERPDQKSIHGNPTRGLCEGMWKGDATPGKGMKESVGIIMLKLWGPRAIRLSNA